MLASCRTGTAVLATFRFSCSSFSSSSSSTTNDKSLRMKRAPFISRRPPMIALGYTEDDHGAADPHRVGEEARDQAAHEAADEEDVERRHRRAHAAQAVGNHGLQHRADHRERRRGEHRLRHLEDPEPRGALHAELQGHQQRRRHDEQADQRQRACGILAVLAVEVAPDQREDRQGEDAREAQDDAALQHALHVEVLVEVERLEGGLAEQPEPEGAEADEHGADGADALDAGERRLHRDRRRLLVFEDLAEDVLLLELTARWFLHPEREQRHEHDGNAEQEPGPAPALDAARPRRDRRADHGADEPDAVAAHVDGGRHPGADADRVVVGDQRLVDGDAVGLGDAGGEAGPEQHERARPRDRTGTRRTRTRGWPSRRSGRA